MGEGGPVLMPLNLLPVSTLISPPNLSVLLGKMVTIMTSRWLAVLLGRFYMKCLTCHNMHIVTQQQVAVFASIRMVTRDTHSPPVGEWPELHSRFVYLAHTLSAPSGSVLTAIVSSV